VKAIRIRPATIDDCLALGRVLVGATASAFEGRVPDRCLKWLPVEQSAANWAKNFENENTLKNGDLLFVAESESAAVIGLAMLCKARALNLPDQNIERQFSHELVSLQIDPDWQRKGIGRLLIAHVAAVLWDEGITKLLVRVLVDNPNRDFYDHLGAVQLGTEPYDWSGYKTEMLIYGWDDTSKLIVKEGSDG
jgi:GNAT superfamily N-acetyltransferase